MTRDNVTEMPYSESSERNVTLNVAVNVMCSCDSRGYFSHCLKFHTPQDCVAKGLIMGDAPAKQGGHPYVVIDLGEFEHSGYSDFGFLAEELGKPILIQQSFNNLHPQG